MTAELSTVEREEALRALEEDWWRLWARVPSATPFQSPAWLLPWWRVFAPGALRVLVVRHGDRLVGLAPFYLDANRRALPLGIGLSDYLDVLVDPADFAPVAALLAGAIRDGLASGVQQWELCDLAPGAQALRLFPEAAVEDHVADPCPVLTLPESASASSVIPAGRRRHLRTARNRAERAGGCTVEQCHGGTVTGALGELARLHRARWAERGGNGVLSEPEVQRFHAQALPALDRAGLLRLLVCRIHGDVVGVYYGLRHRERAYAYIGGFDPAQAFFSPGALLIGHAIDQAAREGAREFHFLRGGESYKYEWGATDRRNRRRVFRPAA